MKWLIQYHIWWVKMSGRIDRLVYGRPVLSRMKRLFDTHFVLIGLLGLAKTPKDDLDCWLYIFCRSRVGKYDHISYSRRLKMARILIKKAWRG